MAKSSAAAPKKAKTRRGANGGPAPAAAPQSGGTRRLKAAQYRSFRMQKKVKVHHPTLPGSFRIGIEALGILRRNWKLFGGIFIVYAVLSLVLVQGFAATDLSEAKAALTDLLSGNWAKLVASFSLLAYLVGAVSASANPAASVYQFVVGVVVSLAVIWALRQAYSGRAARIRDSFYLGMTPLVPFVLVMLVIGLQLLPVVFGIFLFSLVTMNGLAATSAEQVLWVVLLACFALTSLYMLASSLFALYIVSLPNMTPMAALRSARQLVQYRRLRVLRTLLFLPVALVLLGALIMVPLIMFVTPAAPWVFFVLSLLVLPLSHSYLYTLYRKLL